MTENISASPAWRRANTDWFSAAHWGVFFHYMPTGYEKVPMTLTTDDWNRQVDSVDVDRLAAGVAACGAGYVMFTVGQNTGFYCSPNPVYDELVGHTPSRCSHRDLIFDLSNALARYGLHLFAYLPTAAPVGDTKACAALGFLPPWDASRIGLHGGTDTVIPWIDERLSVFQCNWENVVRVWAQRWGKNLAGWWLDGCYYADKLLRHTEPPNWHSFASAFRAGNPDALLSFCPGIRIPVSPCSEYDDFTAGEIADKLPLNGVEPGVIPLRRFINGAQYHILTYLGDNWGRGSQPRFPDELVVGYVKHLSSFGGVSTWDAPIEPDGNIPESFRKQLDAIGAGLKKNLVRRNSRKDA